MTKRCRHELETKDGYPEDIICNQCQTIWTLRDYIDWDKKQLQTLPPIIRGAVARLEGAE